jgi:Na+-transporting methylmalonyl-CoA/oxaloacetate decarboxylase gamma subunit
VKEESNIQKKYSKMSITRIFLILIILILVISPIGAALAGYFPSQKPEEITAFKVGDTVLAGMKVVDENKIRKVPITYYPTYLWYDIINKELWDLTEAIFTGSMKTPFYKVMGGSISRAGTTKGFVGPGMLIVKDNKLIVKPPGEYVYGFKTAYLYGIKTREGLKIKEENKTLSIVPYEQINNNTVPHDYVDITVLKNWYTRSDLGDYIALDYGISDFNDGRNTIPPEKIESFFGDNVVDYMKHYPGGDPVLVYTSLTNQKVIGVGGDVLGSFPQYNDANRAFNAVQFVYAWNGTIIPPNTSSSGKETVGFEASADPHAPGGFASHGACPPARALRGASSSAGFPLPTGMNWEEFAVLFGHNPATGIFVYNTRKYPVQIIMSTEGHGTNMAIYAKIIEFIPSK